MNLKVFIGACVLSGLVACSSVKQDEAGLSRPGVSLELAQFRKEHFSNVRYNLFFSIPESRDEAIRGNAELSLRLDEKQPLIIDFRGEPEQVTSVTLNGGDIPYEVKDEHIVIASDWVAVGENRVAIAFTPADQSLNRRDEFLYTLLVPDRARTVFPCFDQPDMKSLFTLTLEVPSTWQAVANGAITQTDSTGVSGRNRISFKETEPLSTYLFSFVAGKLTREVYSRNGRDISIYHRETDPKKIAQCPAIADEVFDALEWQEDFTGIPYPFAKYDVIILPGFQYGGMEHTGATLYTDRRMFLDEHPTLNERLSRSSLIAHETSHMWFGDYVTMKWFDDVWTKEVFANYFASRIVEPLYPDVNHRLNFIRDYIPASYSEDRTAGANPIKQDLDNLRNAGLVYGNIIYDKSPVIMETEPLSTYLFSFVAGKLTREVYSRNGRDISIYHRETDPKKIAQCPAIADEVFDALEWQEDFTGIPYPFAKYDVIILPGFQYGGMEHTGATLYTDRRMFLDEHPTLNERLSRSSLIAHETSHMWFGDYVTMKWFDDVWTKEVFANYFASRIVEPLYPDVNHRLNFIRDYIPASYSEDRTAGANPIKQDLDNLRNAGLVYGNIIYDKSPVIMEMLVRVLGEDAFQQGIREYLTTYAYGNATWEGLIRILNKYTEEDLAAWSEVWVNQKGMPEITASVKDGELVVEQRDPLGRGLKWPQELTYRVICGTDSEEIPVSLEGNSDSFRMKLSFLPNGNCVILPNINGRGYGFFKITEGESSGLWSVLRSSEDEVLKGSLLITLYENLRWKTISPQGFREEMLAYLPNESNSLLFSMALSYLGDCQRIFPSDSRPLEQVLWKIVTTNPVSQHRLQAFRLYRSIADSEEAVQCLYTLWQERKAPKDCALSESDYIGLSYMLAMHLPEKADKIIATQLSRIQNPDRKKEYQFISPSVSPRKAERDSVFASLLIAGNRRVEPWASSALANLNHRLREQESVAYIRPALEAMPEVQRTGDIFFPTAWVRSLLSAHTSKEAREEVDAFFTAHPDFPLMLSNKIKQQASHLY